MNRRHLPGNFVDNPKVLFRKTRAKLEEIINTSARSFIQSRRSPKFHPGWRSMDAAAGGAFLSLTIPQAIALVEKMASNQGWNEERTQTRKKGGGMHQLKEVDMLSATK